MSQWITGQGQRGVHRLLGGCFVRMDSSGISVDYHSILTQITIQLSDLVVQAVLLFGAETWVLLAEMDKIL